MRSCLMTYKDLSEREERQPLNTIDQKDEPHLPEHGGELSSWGVVKCSLYLSPIWFITEIYARSFIEDLRTYSNCLREKNNWYLSNSALANTSVASTTVLTSTSGLFTLFFGALIGQESINFVKVVAVFISIAGVAMTTIGKTWASDEMLSVSESRRHSITGDIFGLLSAISYGLFTVLLKKSAGSEEEKVDVQKFFGYIGLFTLLGLWWLGKALSVVWTNPLVATLGMSLTIPLAMIADMVIHNRHFSAVYIFGCIQVFAGFIIANLSDKLSVSS
ncbi:hypothetical protein SLEP1_g1802 [Rubroshorea leprosula]|uniref:EamA domain-containing protein n=1 Tax=Rubroshorea leprosula TaxID=152421 RepID=A0AAV5HJH5_9ROSI|nr:hypothetical protein SLEP1_g1802 [Rubroshorea leprosula]